MVGRTKGTKMLSKTWHNIEIFQLYLDFWAVTVCTVTASASNYYD